MPTIGAYEAKTHLSNLLERIQKGERFIITKHGHPLAELIPVGGRDSKAVKQAIDELRALKNELRQKKVRRRDLLDEGETLRDLAHEGHRY
ncbi:MAG TPA: type II toxin-antitoxin system prevent-host-death family antitoxin [Gammaproteobacteria bacterium]|nr:type II toxin-antitoxin system prevent-host-death family antitoxin [Gammaproteobacteria bacterium]